MKRYRIARAAIHPRPRIVLALVAALFACFVACCIAAPRFGTTTGVALFALGVATFIALLVYVNLSGGRLDLGADGLLVDLRDTRRYVAFAQLSDAAPYAERQMRKCFVGVVLQLASGEQVKVPLGEDLLATRRRVFGLAEVVRAALAAYRGRDRADFSTALARRNLTTEQWLRRLRTIGAAESPDGHRERAVTREGLWCVVEDFSADACLRAGAAVALAAALDGEERVRLRGAADGTASPWLRVALEAAASGDETRLVAALDEEEDDEVALRRAGRG